MYAKSREPDYRPYDPNPISMHETALDEITSALIALHTNLDVINKILAELLPKILKGQTND